jgi:prepilin-type processing-associated H-X9-DG protein
MDTNLTDGGLGLGGDYDFPQASVFDPTKDNEVLSPSHMIAIGDANLLPVPSILPGSFIGWNDLEFVDEAYLWYGFGQNPPGLDPMILAAEGRRHDGSRRNILFCDGHVESLTLSQLFNYHSDAVLSCWNKDYLPHRELVQDWL